MGGSRSERVTLPAQKYSLQAAIWIVILLTLSIVSPTHYSNAATTSQTSAAKAALNWLSSHEKADGSFEDFSQIPTPGAALALWLNDSHSAQAGRSLTWLASQLDNSSSYAWGEADIRSEEHTSELQSPYDLVCRLLLEKKKKTQLD